MSGGGGANGRIDDIEILRAFAILFVLVEHSSFNLFPLCEPIVYRIHPVLQFWSGVDLFFAISGFVIARSLLPGLARCATIRDRRRAILAFWMRRATRLLPTAWLWLAIILAGAAFYNRSLAWGRLGANLVSTAASMLDVQNVRMMRHLGVGIGASFPYWSLSLEEQFYILLPLAAIVSRRWLPLLLAVAVVVQFPATRLGSLALWPMLMNAFRTDGLALGVLIALWSGSRSWRRCSPERLLALGGSRAAVTVGLLGGLALVTGYGQRVTPNALGWVAAMSAALVLIASYDRNILWPAGRSKRLLLWIGSRSYGIYVIHIPCFDFVRETWFRASGGRAVIDGGGGHLTALLALTLVAGLAELNFRLIETPCRRAGRRLAALIEDRGARQGSLATAGE